MLNGEIELFSCIKKIIKRKTTVLLFLAFSLLIVIYSVYLSPQLYEAKAMIRVGAIVRPLMSAHEAGYLLEHNRSLVVSSLKPLFSINEAYLLSMYKRRRIVFKEGTNNDLISIEVKCKSGSRAVDICNAIAAMLESEGIKIYNRERLTISAWIQEYEVDRATINQLLPAVPYLQELKNFYERRNELLSKKILELDEKLYRANNFCLLEAATYAKKCFRLSFDQILAIIGMGLIIGIIFVSLQGLIVDNF